MGAFFRWLIALPVALIAVAAMMLYMAARFGEQRAIGGDRGVEVSAEPAAFISDWVEQVHIFCHCVWWLPDPADRGDVSWYGAKADAPRQEETIERRITLASSEYGSYYGNPSPDYPAACMDRGVEGEVTVAFDVAPSGAIRRARVLSSPDRCFDREVVRAVSRWRYPPAYRNGRAVTRRGVTETFVFRLENYG